MIEVAFSSTFKKSFKKLIKGSFKLESQFFEKLEIFIENPYDTRLKTHQLSGKLTGIWSFSLNYKLRITFTFIQSNRVILENIGPHDVVY